MSAALFKELSHYSCVDPDIFTGGSESYLSFPGGGDLKHNLGNFIKKCKFKDI